MGSLRTASHSGRSVPCGAWYRHGRGANFASYGVLLEVAQTDVTDHTQTPANTYSPLLHITNKNVSVYGTARQQHTL